MQVAVAEVGSPSKVTSRARRFTPQGAVILGQLLERFTFADTGSVLIDWSDELGNQQVPNPYPVMYVRASKRLPYDKQPYVNVEVRLDVEDLFGNDNVTADNLVEVVMQMESAMLQEIEKRRNADVPD